MKIQRFQKIDRASQLVNLLGVTAALIVVFINILVFLTFESVKISVIIHYLIWAFTGIVFLAMGLEFVKIWYLLKGLNIPLSLTAFKSFGDSWAKGKDQPHSTGLKVISLLNWALFGLLLISVVIYSGLNTFDPDLLDSMIR